MRKVRHLENKRITAASWYISRRTCSRSRHKLSIRCADETLLGLLGWCVSVFPKFEGPFVLEEHKY